MTDIMKNCDELQKQLDINENDNEVTDISKKEKKKKKSKKKSKKGKFSFKKFLKNAMKSSKTDEEIKKAHQDKIKESLGGGQFSKIDFI